MSMRPLGKVLEEEEEEEEIVEEEGEEEDVEGSSDSEDSEDDDDDDDDDDDCDIKPVWRWLMNVDMADLHVFLTCLSVLLYEIMD